MIIFPPRLRNLLKSPTDAPLTDGPSVASTFAMSRSRLKSRQFQSAPSTHLKRPSNPGSPGALPGASRKPQFEQARLASGQPSVEKRLAHLIGWPRIERLGGLNFV